MTEGYDGDSEINTLFPVECPVCPDEEKTHIVEGPIRFIHGPTASLGPDRVLVGSDRGGASRADAVHR